MIDRVSGVPAYRQVAADLRARISSGEYPEGSKLPPERQMTEHYGVSRITIREAVGVLRSEGLVSAEHGRGVFVRQSAPVVRLSRSRLSREARKDNRGYFLGDAAANDFRPAVRVEIRTESASVEHAEVLGVEVGAELLVRARVMLADDHAIQLATSRLPRAITRGTRVEDEDTGTGGIYARLEDAGHALGYFVESVSTRMPTTDEASALQLAPGTPVLVVRRVAHAKDGGAVEVNDMVLSGPRYELRYEIPAD